MPHGAVTARAVLPVVFLVLLAALTRLPAFGFSVIDWDESLYVLVAEGWRAGHLPYTGVWDNKPLGIYAIFAIFQAAFGDSIAAIRLAGVTATAATACLIRVIVGRIVVESRVGAWPGTVAGALFVLVSIPDDGLASNTELFMVVFTCGGMLLALGGGGGGPGRQVAAGIACGVACMIKYVAVFDAAAVFLALLACAPPGTLTARGAASAGVRFASGMVAPVAAALLLYGAAGELTPFLRVSLLSYLKRAAAPVSAHTVAVAFREQALLCFPISLSPVALLTRGPGGIRHSLLLLVWIAAAACGASVGGFFYSHYFLQVLPPLCVTTGVLFGRLRERLPARPIALAAAALVLAVPAARAWRTLAPMLPEPGSGMFRPHDAPARIAADLRAALNAAPGETIYVFDAQPIIYSLARAVPPTRYAFPSYLLSRLLSRVAGVDPLGELGRIMDQRPLFVVRERPPRTGFAGGTNDLLAGTLDVRLAAAYTLWRAYGDCLVYRRRAG